MCTSLAAAIGGVGSVWMCRCIYVGVYVGAYVRVYVVQTGTSLLQCRGCSEYVGMYVYICACVCVRVSVCVRARISMCVNLLVCGACACACVGGWVMCHGTPLRGAPLSPVKILMTLVRSSWLKPSAAAYPRVGVGG